MNDNSSRFGKFLELKFERTGAVMGGKPRSRRAIERKKEGRRKSVEKEGESNGRREESINLE